MNWFPFAHFVNLHRAFTPAGSSNQPDVTRFWAETKQIQTEAGLTWTSQKHYYKLVEMFSYTWAGEFNHFSRRAGVSNWAVTVQESWLTASTLERFGPCWSLYFIIEHALEVWGSPTAQLPTDHLRSRPVQVFLTNWWPRLAMLVGPHLQSAWTQVCPIHQPDRVWRAHQTTLNQMKCTKITLRQYYIKKGYEKSFVRNS